MLGLSSLPSLPQSTNNFVQVGQIPVGLESAQQRLQRVRPVEQAAEVRGPSSQKPAPGEKRTDALDSEREKRKEARQAVESKIEQTEQDQLKTLAARDREVRAHEQAHKAVAGSYGGAIHYEYERGPDGNRYAVGGEVSIDTSPEATPEATLAKARVIQRAANAPAEPSDQDRAVAAQAAQMEQLALQQLSQKDPLVNRSAQLQGSQESGAKAIVSSAKPEQDAQEPRAPVKPSEADADSKERRPLGVQRLGLYEMDSQAGINFRAQA